MTSRLQNEFTTYVAQTAGISRSNPLLGCLVLCWGVINYMSLESTRILSYKYNGCPNLTFICMTTKLNFKPTARSCEHVGESRWLSYYEFTASVIHLANHAWWMDGWNKYVSTYWHNLWRVGLSEFNLHFD